MSEAPVIEQVGARLELVGDGEKDELRHQPRGVQCSPASSLFSSLKRRINSSKIGTEHRTNSESCPAPHDGQSGGHLPGFDLRSG